MVRPVSPLLRALFLSRAAFPCLAAALVALPARAQVCEPAPTRDAQHLLQAAETDELFAKALMEAAQACRIPGELCDGALQRCRTYANALGAHAGGLATRLDLCTALGSNGAAQVGALVQGWALAMKEAAR